jgi:HlyD family secretion protein
VKLGPRREQVDAVRGQIEQARGAVSFYETTLNNTIIRAPVTGTILERAVERGEFVTTSFVGERGAKGYVVSLADLNDLEVELDISQNDFNKLSMKQKGSVTLDAYPDKTWAGYIKEMSPEADRQKATVQVKVKIANPDEFLRPEMNATVAFLAPEEKAVASQARVPGKAPVYVPPAAVRDGKVLIALGDRAVQRAVKTGQTNSLGLRVDDGLIGGEDVIVNAPAELKDGDRIAVRRK